MASHSTKSFVQKPADVKREWHIVDAKGKTLGRIATTIATYLSGKNKVTYTPHVDGGDYVVVINAAEVAVTGRKEERKIYYRHSGYPGGIKSRTLSEVRSRKPEFIIEHAVRGMLPKNKLAKDMLARLKVFAGAEHTHTAQQPKELEI